MEKPSTWKPSRPDDLKALSSCKWLTADRVNSWPTQVCSGLTAFCLNDFDVTDLNSDCAGKIPTEEYELFSAETVKEFLNIDPLQMTPDSKLLKGLLRRTGGAHWSPILRHYVVRNAKMAKEVLDGASRQVLALFFNSPNLRSMDPKVMSKFLDAELIKILGDDALSMLTPSHLQVFDENMFQSISSKQFGNLPQEVFVAFTAEHADWMTKGQRASMTVSQMFSIGIEPLEVMHMARNAQQTQHARLELWMALEDEPCRQMLKYKEDFAPNAYRVLEERCETAVWAWEWLQDDLQGKNSTWTNGNVPSTFHAFPVIAISCSFAFYAILGVSVWIFTK